MITEHINISLNNPVIGNHIVYGQAILPGLAYIDLIYQVFRKHGHDYRGLELRNLTIQHPLAVDIDNDILLHIECTANDEGKWQIVIEGSVVQQGITAQEKRRYVTAEMHVLSSRVFDDKIDIVTIRQTAKETFSLEEVYQRARAAELIHHSFIKATGNIYKTGDDVFIDIEVGADAADSATGFMFHPTLIDGAAMGTGLFPLQENGKALLFLPLFYESFYATALLQDACMARYSFTRRKDLLDINITFFNREGQKVAALQHFSNKLVREAGLINPQRITNAADARTENIKEPAPKQQNSRVSSASIQAIQYLQQLMAESIGQPAEQMNIKAGYYELGLSSASLLVMVETISQKLNTSLSPVLLFEYTTIAELAEYLSDVFPDVFGGTAEIRSAAASATNIRVDVPVINEQAAVTQRLPDTTDIAVIGIAGRYPAADNIAEFWENLLNGKDCITEVPAERWNWHRHDGMKSPSGKQFSRWGGFINNVDCFDPSFFRISPRDAETMDPQERIFLEVCWETMEDAGYTPVTLAGNSGKGKRNKVGVFAGVMHKDYALIGAAAVQKGAQFPLSLNYAQIANRVSYSCNFHGPSMAIDTVCSSSLTALHLALESIRHGESEVALAGGVNLSLHPDKYLSYGLMDLHASDGYCHAFGKGGDGYVSGECVAAVLLKPLNKAVEDHDHIYAVIKGSTINHGGAASGIYVPNPVAQADMILSCLEKTGIDPRSISYVEAHGTGTSLGDPIEMQGLVKAYRQYTADKQYCAIGSVKSNIGHAESAAGISGLSKVLLQLYHKTLVPSLHAGELNPYIDFSASPFYVQQQVAPWETSFPRRAALSSFGATGANAHVILEEYIPSVSLPETVEPGLHYLVPLSAKNKERLLAYAARLLHALQQDGRREITLTDIAYTLQTGREAMEQRVAFIVQDIAGLTDLLKTFVTGGHIDATVCLEGHVKAHPDIPGIFSGDEDSGELILTWLKKRRLKKIAELWVKGLDISWNLMYTVQPQRVSLPAYPFAREHYWIPEAENLPVSPTLSPVTIHPLLHQNTSDFTEQRFSTTFTGNEFFLADHVAEGRHILPGVAYLEMARAAAAYATGIQPPGTMVQLKNIVWARPLVANGVPLSVHISLYPEDNGEISYEIYDIQEDAPVEKVIYSTGHILLSAVQETVVYDIAGLLALCSKQHFPGDECYRIFNTTGITYGPAFQGIREIYTGTGQLLAKIKLPAEVSNTAGLFVLHPSLLDAAMQTVIMLRHMDGHTSPALAFALTSLRIHNTCKGEMWAYSRYSEHKTSTGSIQQFDIDLCDDQGAVCISIAGLASRSKDNAAPTAGTWQLAPVWNKTTPALTTSIPDVAEKVLIIGSNARETAAISKYYPQATLLEISVGDTQEVLEQQLKNIPPVKNIIWITAAGADLELTDDAIIHGQQEGVLQGFRLIKTLLHTYRDAALSWTVITRNCVAVTPGEEVDLTHAGIQGIAGALAKECPHWKIVLADVRKEEDIPWGEIFTLTPDAEGSGRAYRNGQWYHQQMDLLELPAPMVSGYRKNGVYVVIGGAGGVGAAWSEYMIRTYNAQIIWLGRRPKDDAIQTKLDELALAGVMPEYISADATDLTSLTQAYQQIKSKYPRIHGVVQAAMVLHGRNLISMEEEGFLKAYAVKVDASVRMAQVFEKEPLDFVLFFSSVVAFIRNGGQSNYAAGSIFMDAFAKRLPHTWACKVRIANWGYWGNVGMVADSDALQEWVIKNGHGLITPAEGMLVLEKLLSGPFEQVVFMKTTSSAGLKGFSLSGEKRGLVDGVLPATLDTIKTLPFLQVLTAPSPSSFSAAINVALRNLLWTQLQELEPFRQKHFTLDTVSTAVSLPVIYHRWLQESLEILVEDGYLEANGNIYTKLEKHANGWAEWEKQRPIWLAQSGEAAWMILAETMLRALPQILSGSTPATDIMFPGTSAKLVAGIYRENAVADYFNEVLAQTVLAYTRERLQQDPSSRIRILEIGAGTGATSATVFERLRGYEAQIREYCYTDISRAFLLHGEDAYGEQVPYLTYKLLDAAMPVAQQGFLPGSYDLVIAANVLHATKNIVETLRNAKTLLAKNGLLLLNEVSDKSLFAHLTFGLLKGWWLYEDPALRIPGCPGLYPETWKTVLTQEGMKNIWYPASSAHICGQQVVVAESDGVISQHVAASQVIATAVARHLPKPPDKTNVSAPGNAENGADHVKELIIEKLSVSLKSDPSKIDKDIPFADYGLDSITGVRMVQLLNDSLKISLETTILFDYSSVNNLAAYILQNCNPVIAVADTRVLVPEIAPVAYLKRKSLVQQEVSRKEVIQKEPVAIIGMSGKFAGADTVNQLWEHLSNGTDLVDKVNRWDLSAFYQKSETYCDQGSFIDDIAAFDPAFFNISALEATYMDPQQRLFLEEAWKALEDAGYAGNNMQHRLCGIYVGCNGGDYRQLFKDGEDIPAQAFWGNLSSIVPARIAYYLDLHGPAIAVDTACSSSLVAIHLACQGLWGGEIAMALAGGVFVQSTPNSFIDANRAGMLSPTGRCHTFDDAADGFVLGEGVGVVVLKRLKDALQDGDHIYGVIRGSGINQDGTSNGITAPSAVSQERLECQVYDDFNIDPDKIQMVETHGTGTRLGDPIEFQALSRAFRKYTSRQAYCAIGSVKTNIGHITAPAGVAGLIKVLLSLQHKKMPASLHYNTGNTNIAFEGSPFYVNTTLRDWDTTGYESRVAALSSFGLSGTNAHMVIEEAPLQSRKHLQMPAYLVVLSARSEQQLQQQVLQLLDHCEQFPDTDLGNLSYTLLLGRKHFQHRFSCVASQLEVLKTQLRSWQDKGAGLNLFSGNLSDSNEKEQATAKKYAEDCIQQCEQIPVVKNYVEQLVVVAELFVKGYALPLDRLFTAGNYSRISLPVYPFARDHYWVEAAPAAQAFTPPGVALQMLAPVWETFPVTPVNIAPAATSRMLLAGGTTAERNALLTLYPNAQLLHTDNIKELAAQLPEGLTHIIWIATESRSQQQHYNAFITAQEDGVLACFRLIRALLQKGYATQTLDWTIITRQCIVIDKQEQTDPTHAGLHGLAGSLAKEYPHWAVRLIDLPTDTDIRWKELLSLPADSQGNALAYRHGHWYRQQLAPIGLSPASTSLYRQNGVYVVIGGAGGIGRAWTEYMIRTYQAQVIWIGRRKADEEILFHSRQLGKAGPAPEYMQADAGDAAALKEAREAIIRKYGCINGIVQSAIVLSDQSLSQMEERVFQAALHAKVDVSVCMAQVFAADKPDFVLFFSALNAFIKAPGQSNYAAGSTFEDAFAQYLSQHWPCAVKTINWGYWGSTGIVSGDNYRRRMTAAGIGSIEPPEAMAALEQLLTGSLSQVALIKAVPNLSLPGIIIKGTPAKAEENILTVSDKRRNITAPQSVTPQLLKNYTRKIIRESITGILKTADKHIRDDDSFSALGVDSIISVQLITKINKAAGCNLNTSALFDYSTISQLTQYVAKEYADVLTAALQPQTVITETHIPVIANIPLSLPIVTPAPVEKEPVAIIGISGRFPGADSLDELWEHLSNGDDLVKEVSRWDLSSYTSDGKLPPCHHGGFLDKIDLFDPWFFNITALEANYMDPQQRLFLEEGWKALENAGYTGNGEENRLCGVYVGCHTGDYQQLLDEQAPPQAFWGNADAVVPARIAYHLNLQGPAIAVDTACSSSLVAIHLACQALWTGEISMALAGGVFVQSTPRFYLLAGKAGMLSATGRCYTFDERADGFIPGEGIGAVVLKKLADAQRDGDHIYGVIRGSAINQDGTTNGIIAPSGNSQERLECQVYDSFNIHPENIGMVEAHGTATKLGDPIEFEALTRAFRKYTDKQAYCAIGSIKSSMGHASAAAGIAGLSKILLSLQHRQIPPSLHFRQGNSSIRFDKSPFYVNTQLQEWRITSGHTRQAALSAFGFSGTNVHMVIEEAPQTLRRHAVKPAYLVVLSARTQGQLKSQVQQLLAFSEKNPDLHTGDLSYTLLMGRKQFNHRLSCIVADCNELQHLFRSWLEKGNVPGINVAVLQEGEYQEQEALRKYGEECIRTCGHTPDASEYKECLSAVASLYVNGYTLPFATLFSAGEYGRIPLPGYPLIRERYWIPESNTIIPAVTVKPAIQADGNKMPVLRAVEKEVAMLLSAITGIASAKLDETVTFEELGLDSLMITHFSKGIEKWTGHLDTTLFFRYHTIRALAKYLVDTWPEAMVLLVQTGSTIVPVAPATVNSSLVNKTNTDISSRRTNVNGYTDIAIIGVSGRYPQAETLARFWQNLVAGKDCIEEIPADRWPLEGFYEPDISRAMAEGLSYSKWGGFLKDVDCFDPLFFNISPRNAALMDPQERLFLEAAWACIEDAGYTRKTLEQEGYGNRIGVFAGATFNNYQLLMAEAARQSGKEMYVANSQIYSIANRVSYVMNFTGPSLTVDTACSSSLQALHLACESIRRGESRMALAGGVNLSLHNSKYITLSQEQFGATDGRCRAFGEGGSGYVPAEAVGVVFLKPLSEAVADKDHIYGVIKGTAASHAGKTNGYTIPGPAAQSQAIETALRNCDMDARSISCVEAHGTGTSLGDPIEVAALTDVFRKYTADTGFCALSSVKSNIGHAEAAAGIAQLTKVLLQLRHRTLVKNLMHGQQLNPNISFAQTPFVVQTNTTPWIRPVINGVEVPRRAGISSFGAGGANVHVIVEEYTPVPTDLPFPTGPFVIVLSAKNEERLRLKAAQLLEFISTQQPEENDLVNIAYTLQTGREAMDERLAFTADTLADLSMKLSNFIAGTADKNLWRGNTKEHKASLSLMGSTADLQQLIDLQVHQKNYDKMLDYWAKGVSYDWHKLYPAGTPGKIGLPTYPFAKERCRKGGGSSNNTTAAATVAAETYELLTFEEVWEIKELTGEETKPVKIVVCLLEEPAQQQLVAAIHPGITFVFVAPGNHYQKLTTHRYTIQPTAAGSYEQAFAEITTCVGKIDTVLYGWALTNADYIEDSTPIVLLLQALTACKIQAVRCLLTGLYQTEQQRCYLESWTGIERSLGMILPRIQMAVVFSKAADHVLQEWLLKCMHELQAFKMQSAYYDGGVRQICTVRPVVLEDVPAMDFKPGGTYLITGGCGGLGLLFARYLAGLHPVNLILTGRSPLDAVKQAAISALEKLGSHIWYIQADICDEEVMRNLLQNIFIQTGNINGVIHAAGIATDTSVLDKSPADFRAILSPKVAGTIILDHLLQGHAPDFVCYFSSSSGILGDFGSCDYAMANRFQNAYARYRYRQQLPGKTVVINWPLWKEGGMQFEAGETTHMYLKSSGQRLLETVEGMAVFTKLLSQPRIQHMVITGQRARVLRFLGLDKSTVTAASSSQQPVQPLPVAFTTTNTPVKNNNLPLEVSIEKDLKEMVSHILDIAAAKLDHRENLADLGFDSVRLTAFANRISTYFAIEITPALFFGYPTLEKLTAHFIAAFNTEMVACYHKIITPVDVPQQEKTDPGSKGSMAVTLSGTPEPIAITGMSGRFPQARNTDEMWDMLEKGINAVEEIPADRFDWRQYSGNPETDPEKTKCRWCGCIPGVKEFDPAFFNISPREATEMDPRQRLLMQEAWRALEDAGYGPEQLKNGRVGMFVGVEEGDYHLLNGDVRNVTATHTAILASRLAYFLNLNGPVMAINTACSSGLSALHQACASLRNNECDAMIVAGVNLVLLPERFVWMDQMGMLSADGKCFVFDKKANGMVPGEAVVAVVLKRLSRAEADGDPVYAVISGSGMNYDGRTNGITAPGSMAQTSLLKETYEKYAIAPENISYIVTHGTGTRLGDPVEINALRDVFKQYTTEKHFCALTSTKTNFGHTLAASGLVSLVCLVQALRHQTIPASLHCEEESDYIEWSNSPFYVNKTTRYWDKKDKAIRTGAVSAFGFSGTNVHVVVEEYQPPVIVAPVTMSCYPLAFSARTVPALQEKIRDMIRFLQQPAAVSLSIAEISYTLLEGRQHFEHRCMILAASKEEVISLLQQWDRDEKNAYLYRGEVPTDFREQKVELQRLQDLTGQAFVSNDNANDYMKILQTLATHYCQGYNIVWTPLFGNTPPQRIHLPTYPFARKHYWLQEKQKQVLPALPLLTKEPDAESMLYEQVLDDMLNNSISLDIALQRIREI
ncbi:acyl transferase domain-containing protein [Chitinophaga niastensis]|uniref:Acyl transferase domain-containing protein n=1 Tax=Chitinophaga niastensis TaxID=536980 RepID=A0A2P8HPR3_CHINA|nr:SDR family NAD(P)-dependent oxidoreductase [Chitinophaga niastensis]PSL48184.1 acyl transferase domain-containing protein [Chitinophaga niastensis]